MRIAGMFGDDDEDLEETAQEIPLEEVTEETVMPKKKTHKAKSKGKAAQTRSSSKAKTVKRSKSQHSIEKNNGTVRESPRGPYHVMSVHIPIPMLKKLDAKVATLKKQGKEHASRSGFAIHALSSKL